MTIKPTPETLARICLPAGALTIAAGATGQNIALALGGFALLCIGLTAIVVHIIGRAIRDATDERRQIQHGIEHSIRDTSQERRQLQKALAEVEADRMRYVALRAGVDADAERLCRLGVQMEQDAVRQLAVEREKLMAELEDKRAAIMREGFDIGLNLNDRNVIGNALQPRPDAKVIHLPV